MPRHSLKIEWFQVLCQFWAMLAPCQAYYSRKFLFGVVKIVIEKTCKTKAASLGRTRTCFLKHLYHHSITSSSNSDYFLRTKPNFN
ncbi:hypothetical protein EDD18DRAFT_1184085 [Armillaria luteobubalina]|uniref:Secreted protein n=1 Tax=Armillaria luteobubalina TaxID=153913 RepID=A0AA39PZ62_9AGAR|nr:hypothetical protein EDD18DRAFT_1184085 [Armillaria luteobubalina]